MCLVECVPNISEGRQREVWEEVAAASAPGVTLLNVDPGAETNRTVTTFVGEPEAGLEGTFPLTTTAWDLMDISAHHGAHPRIDAGDSTDCGCLPHV